VSKGNSYAKQNSSSEYRLYGMKNISIDEALLLKENTNKTFIIQLQGEAMILPMLSFITLVRQPLTELQQ